MCIVHLMCVFHYFRIFSVAVSVCIFGGVKNWPRRLGAPECRGALVRCTTCTIYCYATDSLYKFLAV